MAGWRLKSSEQGCLPNVSHEPRKPVDLGTEFKNGVECLTSILSFQDILMCPSKSNKRNTFAPTKKP